jgi:hypothetical protein
VRAAQPGCEWIRLVPRPIPEVNTVDDAAQGLYVLVYKMLVVVRAVSVKDRSRLPALSTATPLGVPPPSNEVPEVRIRQ